MTTHYVEVGDSRNDHDTVNDCLNNFKYARNYYETEQGGFVRYMVWENHDYTDEYSHYSDFNGNSNIKLKWRLYRLFPNCPGNRNDGEIHCKVVQQSKKTFFSYKECVKHYETFSNYRKFHPNRATDMRVECVEYDEHF